MKEETALCFELDSIKAQATNSEGAFLDSKYLKKFNATHGFYAKFDPSPRFYIKDIYNQIIVYRITNYRYGAIGVHFMVNKANMSDLKKRKRIDKEIQKILSGFKFYDNADEIIATSKKTLK